MAEVTHSPLPWQLWVLSKADVIATASNRRVARLYRSAVNPEHRADAQLIVRAVNSHAELLNALKACERSHGTYSNGNFAGCWCDACRQARDVIQKAEGC